LIDELLAKVQDSLDLERSAEDKRVVAYTKARKLLNITIGVTQTALANTQTELARYRRKRYRLASRIRSSFPRPPSRTPNRELRTRPKREPTDTNSASKLLKTTRRAEPAGNRFPRSNRDADRQVISQTIGIVNSQLRTLREQLALRLSAGDSLDY
jgi:hypothetical protein